MTKKLCAALTLLLMPAKEALAIAAEDKGWFTLRSRFMVLTRHTVRRVK